jgi:hypothetical protein
MPTLKFRDPTTGEFVDLAFVAQGDKGDQGPPGPPGDAFPVDGLTDVSNAVDTPAGKILGTTATGAWEPVDPPVGDVTEAPIDGNQYTRQDAGWTLLNVDLSLYLPLSGGTLTGPLVLDGTAPVNAPDAADKAYVDSRIWTGTQAQYDALGVYDPEVLYVVTG